MLRQVDIENAQLTCDEMGVPFLTVSGRGNISFHPAYIGLYALGYAGFEVYDPKVNVPQDLEPFRACIQRLVLHLKERVPGVWAWEYSFDFVDNDCEIQAPWISAFGQAVGIEALLASFRIDQNVEQLALAEKAAQAFYRKVQEGGLLFRSEQNGIEDIWFEEIPAPVQNPSHSLRGHLRALLAIEALAQVSKNPEHRDWFQRGLETLKRWLPLFDTGYWLRADLCPKKAELLFRFNNPYGYPIPPVAIRSITLGDPLSDEFVTLHVGELNDAEGALRIAGNDWGQLGKIDGQPCRKLLPVLPASYQAETQGQFLKPDTYFYLTLPGAWQDNLRLTQFVLEIAYWDEAPGNLSVQFRSIAPGKVFRDLPEGDLLLTGSGTWRTWRISLYPNQLGRWVGESEALQHHHSLEKLSEVEPSLIPWTHRSLSYIEANKPFHAKVTNRTTAFETRLPVQTPPLPKFSMDPTGVVRQYFQAAQPDAVNIEVEGQNIGALPFYHPFVVAEQVFDCNLYLAHPERFHPTPEPFEVRPEPALAWLLDQNNYHCPNPETVVYFYDFNNAYNNVASPAPWQSAFAQAHIIKALLFAIQNNISPEADLKGHLHKVINAYTLPVEDGGLRTHSLDGAWFAEEVPNSTHILNAQLFSCIILLEVDSVLPLSAPHQVLLQQLLDSSRKRLAQFDTGYWSRYDQNPKTEVLLQIDWLWGESSPAIGEIFLEHPQTGHTIFLDAGQSSAFTGSPCISGADWSDEIYCNGKMVRPFQNGYSLHPEPVENAHRHNVFLRLPIPEPSVNDSPDRAPYRLTLCFLDRTPGAFNIKIQAIHQENQLSFIPLRQGVWHCAGDQMWKTVEFQIRQQDLGWYMGEIYHQHHIRHLQKLATLTGAWEFIQYAEKWTYYLKMFQTGGSPISFTAALRQPYQPMKPAKTVQSSPLKKIWPLRVLKELKRFRHRFSRKPEPETFRILPNLPPEAIPQPTPIGLKSDQFMGVEDLMNPLHPFRMPIPQALAEETSQRLALKPSLSPHQKIVYLMQTLHDFKVGTPSNSLPMTLLEEKVGSCGDFCNLLLAMLATQGIQGRVITMANFPKHFGHAVIECRVNGRWQVYDPTYAAYYSLSASETEHSPYVLSFDELRRGQGQNEDVQQIIGSPQRMERDPERAKAFLSTDIYERANPAGPIGMENPMIYPLTLDLHQPQPLERSQFGTIHQGADYLGASCVCNLQQWTLTSLIPGEQYQFELVPEHLGGEPQTPQDVFTLNALLIKGGRLLTGQDHSWTLGTKNLAPWTIQFIAYHESVTLLLTHSYRGPHIWYVSVAHYALRPADSKNLAIQHKPAE